MSIDEIATYRLAAGMLELATQALEADSGMGSLQDSAFKLIDDARYMVRDMIEYIDSEHARLNAKHAPSKEAE